MFQFLFQNKVKPLSSPVQDGNWFGATVTGAGDATVVEVFVSTTELGSDPSTWPAPVCTLEGNPATAAGPRVMFFLENNNFADLTPEGLALFDAAVAYMESIGVDVSRAEGDVLEG